MVYNIMGLKSPIFHKTHYVHRAVRGRCCQHAAPNVTLSQCALLVALPSLMKYLRPVMNATKRSFLDYRRIHGVV